MKSKIVAEDLKIIRKKIWKSIIASIIFAISAWIMCSISNKHADEMIGTVTAIAFVIIVLLSIVCALIFTFLCEEYYKKKQKFSNSNIDKISTQEFKQIILNSDNNVLNTLLNSASIIEAKIDERNDTIIIIKLTWVDEKNVVSKTIPYRKEDIIEYIEKIIL